MLPKFTKVRGKMVTITQVHQGETVENVWLYTHVGYLPTVLRDGSVGLFRHAAMDEVYDPSAKLCAEVAERRAENMKVPAVHACTHRPSGAAQG